MAVALEKLQDQLNCSICLDTYSNPKQLQCHHVYCQECLVKLVIRDQWRQLFLPCPTCRQVTPVPASGVAGLQAAFRVNQLLEIVEKHRKAVVATASVESIETTRISLTPDKIAVCCPEHSGKEVALYCETCAETICWKCIKKGEKHHSHNYEELNEAFKRYQAEITSSLEPMEKQVIIIKKALEQLDTRCNEISDQEVAIEMTINDAITRLHGILDVRKTELISQLCQLTQAKLKSLAVQRDQMETTQAQLSSCLHFMGENLKSSNQEEALTMKSTTVRQVKELTTTFQADMLEPNTDADMIFMTLSDLTAECRKYGKVHALGSPDPSKCCLTGKLADPVPVERKATAVLQIADSSIQPSEADISCELVSEVTGTRARGSIERRGQNEFEISYQPTIKGRHQLHVKVEGQHIRGSPFPVSASRPARKLGTPILTIDGVRRPMGVAVNQMGDVVVTEWHGHCVTVFSPSGERLRSFGTRGTGQGQFQFPYGVAVDSNENIFVADCNNHRIQKFTAQGDFLGTMGTKGSGPLKFNYPHGIAVNASNGRVYVGSRNGHIQILNSDLTYYDRFGTRGSGKGRFNIPQHIACCDSTGNVYVADFGNHRIQVFTDEGDFLKQLGRPGEGRGELKEPWGVAVDSSGRVYVSEQWNHRVSVFVSEGLCLKQFGSEGEGPGQFCRPQGLAVDSSGVVYVCDFDNNRIQLF